MPIGFEMNELYRQTIDRQIIGCTGYSPVEISEPEITSIQYIGEPEVQYIDTTAWRHNDTGYVRNTYMPIGTRPFTKEEKIKKEFDKLTKVLLKQYENEDKYSIIPF